jgi:hypothetical protein
VQDEIALRAKISGDAQTAFRETLAKLGDGDAALVLRAMAVAPPDPRERLAGKTSLSSEEALQLVREAQSREAHEELAQLLPRLIAEDDERRYLIDKEVPVALPSGGTVCAMLVRPRKAAKLPALLEFTIYADEVTTFRFGARLAASHGYAAVEGYVRGKACSPDKPNPYVHDARDEAALIDWIAAQPWCDGRVGMFGGSYSGFTAWAATKYLPKALKTIVVGAPASPGVDVPMENGVFWSFVYSWPFYTTDNKRLDDTVYGDARRWQRLDRDWYVSGRPYRELPLIDGTPNPIFESWIAHPSLDAFWRDMQPSLREFARIDIPVLQTVGYFGGGVARCR